MNQFVHFPNYHPSFLVYCVYGTRERESAVLAVANTNLLILTEQRSLFASLWAPRTETILFPPISQLSALFDFNPRPLKLEALQLTIM